MKTENIKESPPIFPWWKRQIMKLYPVNTIDMELPDWAKDGVIVTSIIKLSFCARIAVLLSGQVQSRVFVMTNVIQDRVHSRSAAHPKHPFK